MNYIYHYYASTQHGQKHGAIAELDGILTLNYRIEDWDSYQRTKKSLADDLQDFTPGIKPSDLVLKNLVLLSKKGEQ